MPHLKMQAKDALTGALSPRKALDLSEEGLTHTIVDLALPAVVENLLVTMVFLADTLLIGWLGDPAALAAVSLGGLLIFVLNSFFTALSLGIIPLVARAWGAQDYRRAERVGGQAISLSLLVALGAVALAWPLTEPYFVLMGAEAEVVRLGTVYLHWILTTSVLGLPILALNGVMRAAGDTRTPMWITGIMNVWNVIAAYALIFGPGPVPALGLAGAGMATASARFLGGLLCLGVLLGGRSAIRVPWREVFGWDGRLVRTMVRLSLPAAGEQLIQRVGSLIFMRVVSALGTVSLAAHQVAVQVESISFMPGLGLGVASATLVGQALGAGKVDIAEKGARRTLRLALQIMTALGLVFALFGRALVTVFGATPEVLDLAGLAVRISALEQPSLAVLMVLAGATRGAGDTRTPMWVSAAGVLFFRVPVVYLFAITFGWGLAGVWLGTALDWAARAALMAWSFRRGRWKAIRL
jgi:putative MATE family efflux protein